MACNTCFIIGAGFSAPAKIPVKRELLQNIFRPGNEKCLEYIQKILGVETRNILLKDAPLEDIFSFLDKIITENGSVGDFDIKAAYDARYELIEFLIKELNAPLKEMYGEFRYEYFFKTLAERKLKHNETNTIVTFNWDTIPDFYINRALKFLGRNNGVDYGCVDWSVEDNYVPSSWRKAQGYQTIKVLKLHGSINWSYIKSNGGLYVDEQYGDYPKGFLIKPEDRKKYEHIFMTPTFIKDLSILPAKSIWYNAGLDLAEARRVVFLGYSLPPADYEFRYILMSTAVRNKGNKIRVLLYPNSPPEKNADLRKSFSTLFIDNDLDFVEMDITDFLTNYEMIWNW